MAARFIPTVERDSIDLVYAPSKFMYPDLQLIPSR